MSNFLAAKKDFEFNPMLDTRYLYSIYQGDAENAHYIFELYLGELPETLAHITQYMRQDDITGLFETIHKTKTSFSFVGLSFITTLMEAIEIKCSQVTHTFQLSSEIGDLLEEIQKFTPIIEEEFARLAVRIKQIA
jgi:HPt (histidine-containing phosphotransfer) domain-containing protein